MVWQLLMSSALVFHFLRSPAARNFDGLRDFAACGLCGPPEAAGPPVVSAFRRHATSISSAVSREGAISTELVESDRKQINITNIENV